VRGDTSPKVRRILKYAFFDGYAWHIEIVDSLGYEGLYTSLALDASDRPHVAYYYLDNGDLKYAWVAEPAYRLYLPAVFK